MRHLVPFLVLWIALTGCQQITFLSPPPTTAEPVQTSSIASIGNTESEPGSESSIAPVEVIPSTEAVKRIGQTLTVCGPIVDASSSISRGRPTYLNFDKPHPKHNFLVLIWGSDLKKFPEDPEAYYKGKTACVTGLIRGYNGRPLIEVHDPSQISLQ